MEAYMNFLMKKIENKQPINKEDDTKIDYFINEFKNTLEGLELDIQIIEKKNEVLKNIINNATNNLSQNQNNDLIIGYCISIMNAYNPNYFNPE